MPGRGERFGLVHDRGPLRLNALWRSRNGRLNQLSIDGRWLHQPMGGLFHKYANPHSARVKISRAEGSVQGRLRQGISISRNVLI